MNKKVCCTCEVVVLLIKPIVFLTFSLSSASLDLKLPIGYHLPNLVRVAGYEELVVLFRLTINGEIFKKIILNIYDRMITRDLC